jgi:hypothetical protein
MILKLLPSVAGATPVLKLAAVLVGLCILFGLPAGALCALILIDVGWPSEVLPVMRVNACITLMLLVRKGTPNSLEVEQVKIDVALKVLEHVYRQLWFVVSESTNIAILTLANPVWIVLTKFGLIFLRVVKVFDSVMSLDTKITLGTIYPLSIGDWADFRCVSGGDAPSILQLSIVVVQTLFGVVCLLYLARLSLELHQIK